MAVKRQRTRNRAKPWKVKKGLIEIDKKDRPVSPINGAPLPIGKPFQQGEQQRETARKGGKRSAEIKRKRRALREEFELLLSGNITDKHGKKMNAQTAMATAMLYEAIGGNVRAYLAIKDTLGESMTETHDDPLQELLKRWDDASAGK